MQQGNAKKRRRRGSSSEGPGNEDISQKELLQLTHLPSGEAARALGLDARAFKRLCEKRGLGAWPYQGPAESASPARPLPPGRAEATASSGGGNGGGGQVQLLLRAVQQLGSGPARDVDSPPHLLRPQPVRLQPLSPGVGIPAATLRPCSTSPFFFQPQQQQAQPQQPHQQQQQQQRVLPVAPAAAAAVAAAAAEAGEEVGEAPAPLQQQQQEPLPPQQQQQQLNQGQGSSTPPLMSAYITQLAEQLTKDSQLANHLLMALRAARLAQLAEQLQQGGAGEGPAAAHHPMLRPAVHASDALRLLAPRLGQPVGSAGSGSSQLTVVLAAQMVRETAGLAAGLAPGPPAPSGSPPVLASIDLEAAKFGSGRAVLPLVSPFQQAAVAPAAAPAVAVPSDLPGIVALLSSELESLQRAQQAQQPQQPEPHLRPAPRLGPGGAAAAAAASEPQHAGLAQPQRLSEAEVRQLYEAWLQRNAEAPGNAGAGIAGSSQLDAPPTTPAGAAATAAAAVPAAAAAAAEALAPDVLDPQQHPAFNELVGQAKEAITKLLTTSMQQRREQQLLQQLAEHELPSPGDGESAAAALQSQQLLSPLAVSGPMGPLHSQQLHSPLAASGGTGLLQSQQLQPLHEGDAAGGLPQCSPTALALALRLQQQWKMMRAALPSLATSAAAGGQGAGPGAGAAAAAAAAAAAQAPQTGFRSIQALRPPTVAITTAPHPVTITTGAPLALDPSNREAKRQKQ